MPGNPSGLFREAAEVFIPVLFPVQAGLFLSLLFAVSVWDLRKREIPDCLQLSIAALLFLDASPWNLFGILCALPYLATALFFHGGDGIGGGDIKLAAATGAVLGLPAGLAASLVGLTLFVIYGGTLTALKKRKGEKGNQPFPLGPFLSFGAAAAYFMKIGGLIL